jgi:hypothetical protein
MVWRRNDDSHQLQLDPDQHCVVDPWHFGPDPDPQIRTIDLWIRIYIRIRLRIRIRIRIRHQIRKTDFSKKILNNAIIKFEDLVKKSKRRLISSAVLIYHVQFPCKGGV